MESIQSYAFHLCIALRTVRIDAFNITIALFTFNRVELKVLHTNMEQVADSEYIGSYFISSRDTLENVTFGDSVKGIGFAAFLQCSSLRHVNISASVESIGDYAFDECTSLASVSVPGSVRSVCKAAFVRCSSLVDVSLGYGVESIGDYAFEQCTSLASCLFNPSPSTRDGHRFLMASSA